MDVQFEMEWSAVVKRITKQFGEDIDLQGILYIIGVQELGQGFQKFKKDEKVNIMHIAICTLLEPYGYYEFLGKDEDSWPHFKRNQKLPNLKSREQEILIKKAIVSYFQAMDELELPSTAN
ncbi:MAG: hypothetical protein ACJAU0_002336 [Flavobacteriales bacterium]|jgi:hypothetical protein